MRTLALIIRLAAALASGVLVVGGLSVPAAAHDGGGSECVTKHEWRHVKAGMRKALVHAIFDSRGRFADGHAGGYTRLYRPCAWNGGTDVRLYVSYNGFTHRVVEKRLV